MNYIENFDIGDRVMVRPGLGSRSGMVGEVVYVDDEIVSVYHPYWRGGHDCRGHAPEKQGWNYLPGDLMIIKKSEDTHFIPPSKSDFSSLFDL